MANLNSTPPSSRGEWNPARVLRAETEPKLRYTLDLRRGTQVVRERSAKPSYASSILARASNILPRLFCFLILFYPAVSAFHSSTDQETLGAGLRYKIHSPVILLLMAARSVQPAGVRQPYFVGYFGVAVLAAAHPLEKG